MTTEVSELVERLTSLLAPLDVRADEEWYAYYHKGGYDLCVETARRRPDHPNAATDAIVGRFACGEYAIACLPVVAECMNALPTLLAALSVKSVGEDGLREAIARIILPDDYKGVPDAATVWENALNKADAILALSATPQLKQDDGRFRIIIDDEPFDVAQHYRTRHHVKLPATPTMTVLDIAEVGGLFQATPAQRRDGSQSESVYCVVEVDSRGEWIGPVRTTTDNCGHSFALNPGQRFATFPDGAY